MPRSETEKSDDSNAATVPTKDHDNELEREVSKSDEFPDGGIRAWMVAVGASSAFFCTLGFTNSFGVFQAYYQFHQMPNEPADNIAWIGGIQAFLIFAAGSVGGPLFDRYGAWVRLFFFSHSHIPATYKLTPRNRLFVQLPSCTSLA